MHVSCVLQLRRMHACDTMASQSCIAPKDAKSASTDSLSLCSSMHNSLMSGLLLLWDADPAQVCCDAVIDFWGEVQAPTQLPEEEDASTSTTQDWL